MHGQRNIKKKTVKKSEFIQEI